MQLINPSVYDQQVEARSKAMEETRKEKLRRKAEAEKKRFYSYLQLRNGSAAIRTSGSTPSSDSSSYEVSVDGLTFRVAKGGRKLIRTSGKGETSAISRQQQRLEMLIVVDARQGATPKKALVGGVTFVRSQNGNMWRAGYVSLQRYAYLDAKQTKAHQGLCAYGE